jgi:hypothetical protein
MLSTAIRQFLLLDVLQREADYSKASIALASSLVNNLDSSRASRVDHLFQRGNILRLAVSQEEMPL